MKDEADGKAEEKDEGENIYAGSFILHPSAFILS